MKRVVLSLFKEWRWGDYVQLIHSLGFVLFGFLILVRLRKQDASLGYVIGLSFLSFGLYRIKLFIDYFRKVYGDSKKEFLIRH
ncbi:MAG: hypothetical protein HY036_08030 [Nitrospirae bacterium]|nr:hypothetical protein [Nitrospirota bacterium]MBI3352513.1 hypothetical protein [Nitrospirota bacterium]